MTTTLLNRYEEIEQIYEQYFRENSFLNRKLVSFQANKDLPFYNWFSYREGFSYEMVRYFIEKEGKRCSKILDPFAGSNTTLFTANELGIESTGIELLPIGKFVLDSRIASYKIKPNIIKEAIENIEKIDFNDAEIDDEYTIKHVPITEKAFPAETEKKLNSYLTYVNKKIKNKHLKQVLLFACFCILERISYTRKDGQYLRWDYRAKKGKTPFNKGKIYKFETALYEMLNQIYSDMTNSHGLFIEHKYTNTKMELLTGSCLDILPSLEKESYDLIISSPPYCNRYDYTRTYALELVFLGMNDDQIKELRQTMLSCTVENKDKIEYLENQYSNNNQMEIYTNVVSAFETCGILQDILSSLKELKENKKLNNPKIYDLVRNYFYEHSFVVFQMARVLKKGGRIYYVNDNVQYAGITIPVDIILSEYAQKAGLKIEYIYVLSQNKGNSSQQMGVHGRKGLRKCVYCWGKE